jgi:hypothetical protein
MAGERGPKGFHPTMLRDVIFSQAAMDFFMASAVIAVIDWPRVGNSINITVGW